MTEKQEEYVTENDVNDALEMLGKGYDQEAIIKELPSTMSGFTPAPDVLITKYGFITALVWGKMWRYCQMSDGVCRAKLETLAAQTGMSVRTIIRHSDILVEGGYLKDMTPDLKNKPHIYADTGKIRIKISVEAAMSESHGTVTQSHSHHDRESLEESINKKRNKDINAEANKKVDAILDFQRQSEEAKKQGKGWKQRNQFSFNEHVQALADLCVLRLGEPSKRDLTTWVMEIGSWVDAGARVGDWERAEAIVSGYSQPVVSITGMTKAVKFAAQERKNGNTPQVVEERHPEWVPFVPPDESQFVPAPPRIRKTS